MSLYQNRKIEYLKVYERLNTLYSAISIARLASAVLLLVSLFYLIKTGAMLLLIFAIIFLVCFLLLMKKHTQLSVQKRLNQALVKINSDEDDYLNERSVPFENGTAYQDFSHQYAYDLDIFGNHSLFQNLNRTTTFIGQKKLARQLLHTLSNEHILQNQQAVKELSTLLEWRHDFMALGKISGDNQQQYETLLRWSRSENGKLPAFQVALAFAFPVILISTLAAYFITDNPFLIKIVSFLFAVNLFVLGLFFKRIKSEIQNADGIDTIIGQYSLIVDKISTQDFTAEKLIGLKQKLVTNDQPSAVHLKKLSALFSQMDSIDNLVSTVLFNGFFLYHVHVLKMLLHWKKQHALNLETWLDVIGEFEMLNSLANFSYNNPDFVFPILNSDFKINFSNLSHPLLNKNTRIGNDIDFKPQFMVLTGSNMSGKSTFLRSLGINMVLAGTGSAVCATAANVHPMPVLVSMRLSDSLSDSESYFYAEIKRLKQIMDQLQNQRAFVLLDEILRGTNSDDKRSGTIGVVRKMVQNKAIGAIATHDVEVCLTTSEFPEVLTNKCFEAQIINDDLFFDYKLRDGICQNKSATFLMKKMEII